MSCLYCVTQSKYHMLYKYTNIIKGTIYKTSSKKTKLSCSIVLYVNCFFMEYLISLEGLSVTKNPLVILFYGYISSHEQLIAYLNGY